MIRRLVPMLALLGVLVSTGHATVLTTCDPDQPTTLTGGHYTLDADLTCGTSASLSASAIILEGASLDLQGHTLTCDTVVGPCVQLTGWGSRLGNGTVHGANLEGIWVAGSGGHYLYDLTAVGSERMVTVLSHWNLLVRVHAETGDFAALHLRGMANWIASSTFTCGEQATNCVTLSGHYNAVTWNLVTRAEGVDFAAAVLVTGQANWLARNTIMSVNADALRVSGQGNVLANNSLHADVSGSNPYATALDAHDTHDDCTHNTWVQNRGMTASPACIRLKSLPQSVQR